MHAVAETLLKIEKELSKAFLEREEAIRAMTLALLTGEHPILLGDPGVAKSLLVEFYVEAITNKRYFEIQCSKTKQAERFLGPLDMKRFRETGDRIYKSKGFATDCEIIHLDEVGKMSVTIGHDLLALLNERKVHQVDDGLSVHKAPLHVAFCASNEIPTQESDDAAALWDRLLIRVWVHDLKKKQNFAKLLTQDVLPPTTRLDFDELKKVSEVDVPAIGLSRDALTAIVNLREKLRADNIEPSPRRWRKSVKVLQAAAFLDGQDEVLERHLSVLRFTLWEEPEQIDTVRDRCEAAANPYFDRLNVQSKVMNEITKGIKDRAGDHAALATYGQESSEKLATVRQNLDDLLMEAGAREIEGFVAVADKHRELLIETFEKCMGMDYDVAAISAEKRLGMGGGSVVALEES